jgi:hypothetical protein
MNPFNKNLGNQGKGLSNKVGNYAKRASNKLTEIKNSVSNAATGMKDAIQQKVTNVQQKVTNISEKPEIKIPLSKLGTMTQDFFTANTAISHFVTFMLCLLLFIIILQVGSRYITYLFGPQYNPYIINGMVDSNIQTVIAANPNIHGSVPIYRSIDQNQGVEFSWNVWFFVKNSNELKTKTNALVFSKGKSISPGQQFLGVSPGVYLNAPNLPTVNVMNLIVSLNTFNNTNNNTPYETITIPDIPMKKWVCCTIRAQGTYIDVYINGVLTQRKILKNLPQQNYGDTYIGEAGGFQGYISSLRYYSKAITYEEIQSLFAAGPSLIMVDNAAMPKSSDYLSMNWFYNYTTLN